MSNLKIIRISVLVFFSLGLIAACNQPPENPPQTSAAYSVTDFSGVAVSLSTPAAKVVALAPNIVENVFSAGAGEQLVGVMEYSNFPEQAKNIERVGSFDKVNQEKIIELNPDLIIAWQTGNSHMGVQRLKDLGFTVYIDQADTLRDVAKSIRDIGILTGNAEQAESVANNYLSRLDEIQDRYRKAQKVSTFYQVWNSPLQTISGNHIISHAIEVCGGVNIYRDEFAVAPIINIESVLERDPAVIIASGDSGSRPIWLDEWLKWDSLTAVKQGNLFYLNPDHIQRHTTRLLLGIETICQQLDSARGKLIDNNIN